MSPDSQLQGTTGFPTTCWSRILAHAQGEGSGRAAALETLARLYWRPVYAYVRAKWGKAPDDARDTTQDFFLWMLEGDFLARVDRDRGRFRAVLKAALANYVVDRHRADTAAKRGGGRPPLSIDATLPRVNLPDPHGRSPEDLLDDAWRREVLARAVDLLEEGLAREGKETTFAVFRDYFLNVGGDLDYAAVAARHGLTRSDVGNRLQAAKARYRETLRRLVAETVHGDEDLHAELAWLFGAAMPPLDRGAKP